MGDDQLRISNLSGEKPYKRGLVSVPKPLPYRRITSSVTHGGRNGGVAAAGPVAMFLLKVAALETVRRVSRSKCPNLWRGVQALQVLCFPPFKWIEKWAPFRGFIKGIQMLSRPLLVISVATAISEQLDSDAETSNDVSSSNTHLEAQSDSPSAHSSNDPSNGAPQSQALASETWLTKLHKELENQGIILPERINEDELHRFYTAANGDLSSLLLSIKKTIRWRETYRILTEQELGTWSNMVFWHGLDVDNRPCLIVRLGLACVHLSSQERPRFAQAVISQVEHGILHLVDNDNPHITVLVDCDGISPLKIPMQMMRSCSSLLQDNFPNRLGHLLVIRLPPIVRVIAQTFIQVLKPVTRKKLRIEGNTYHSVLSQYLQTLPSYLGGDCTCNICSDVLCQPQFPDEINNREWNDNSSDGDDLISTNLTFQDDYHPNDDWNHLLRIAVIGILMVWTFIALVAGLYEPESRPFWSL